MKNPQKDYPKALLFSTIIILVSLILSSLAVAIVIPSDKLNLITGLLEAFLFFFKAFGLTWLIPVVAVLIVVGVIGGVGAWLIGPTRGLLVAAKDGCIPPFLQKTNKRNIPIAILITQGMVFSLISFIFLFMPSVNSSFWILSALTGQLALLSYVFMFAAAIWLRYKYPEVRRMYKIPFKNFGIWVTGTFGIVSCAFAIVLGYYPPSQFNVGNVVFYEVFLVSGLLVFCTIPLLIYKKRKLSWKIR